MSRDRIHSYIHAIAVETMAWSSEARVFVVGEIISTGGSPLMKHRQFRGPHDPVPNTETIHNWV